MYSIIFEVKYKPTTIEIERRRRIKVSLWAYAYEIENHSIVDDMRFDLECYQLNLSLDTGNPQLDFWFRANFEPCTGMWIHKHPKLDGIKNIYWRYHAKKLQS